MSATTSGKQTGEASKRAPTAEMIFGRLASAREAGRNFADRDLGRASPEVRAEVRQRIITFLDKECQSGGELGRKSREAANTLTWLLYSLARISDDDQGAMAIVKKNLDPSQQSEEWARYWTLAGLARSDRRDLKVLAQDCLSRDSDPLVRMVAFTLLAREGDMAALAEIKAELNSPDVNKCWAALRAMRVSYVEDEELVRRICELVDKGDNSDITYDALKAAYHVRRTSEKARDAARALIGFVERWRTYPGRDSMRTIALIGLGKLGAVISADLLVEELTDDNPAIVREAARSLEAILGPRTAVGRVLEATRGADTERIRVYSDALRQMEDRETVAAELGMAMTSGSPELQERSRQLLSELGGTEALQKLRVRSSLMSQYTTILQTTEEKIQKLFNESLVEAHRGFRVALRMDIAVFILGFVLIMISAVLQLKAGGNFSADWVGAGATGVTGVLGILYSLLVAKPRKQVTREVDHLMSLKVVFLGYLRQLHQSDQAYVRRVLEDKEVSPEELEKFSGQVKDDMKTALESLGKLQVVD